MSEFRAALQALVDIISKCNTCSIMVIHGHPTEFDAAKALLARPEPDPRITREEAEKLLDAYEYSTTEDKACKAREACLAAMLRNDL